MENEKTVREVSARGTGKFERIRIPRRIDHFGGRDREGDSVTEQIMDLLEENERLKAQIRKMSDANEELFYRFLELSKELRIYEQQTKVRRIEKA